MRKWLAAVAFGFFFAVNPAFVGGCNYLPSREPTFTDAQAIGLVDKVTGARAQRFLTANKGELRVTLALNHSPVAHEAALALPSLVRSAQACTHRTLVKSASACWSTTTVPVDGTATVVDDAGVVLLDRAPVQGRIEIRGSSLDAWWVVGLSGDGVSLEIDERVDRSRLSARVGVVRLNGDRMHPTG